MRRDSGVIAAGFGIVVCSAAIVLSAWSAPIFPMVFFVVGVPFVVGGIALMIATGFPPRAESVSAPPRPGATAPHPLRSSVTSDDA